MPKFRIQCSYCGLPFTVRQTEAGHASYCCSGCALASRLPPVDSNGQFPVTPALIVALGVGFAFFNVAARLGLLLGNLVARPEIALGPEIPQHRLP